MLSINTLKVFAANYVALSNLSEKAKVNYINFIKETSDKEDILGILVTGNIDSVIQENVDLSIMQDAEVYIESLISDALYISEANNLPAVRAPLPAKIDWKISGLSGKGYAAVAGLAAVVAAAYVVYKRVLSKAARACKGQSGSEKTACMKKFKISALQAQINALKSGMAKCKTTKQPYKCKQSIVNKIDKLKNRMEKTKG